MKSINKKAKIILLVILLLTVAVTASVFGYRTLFKEDESGEEDERRTLVLYSSLKSQQLEEIEKYFEAIYPEIDLVCYSAGSGSVIQSVVNEVRTGERKCDLIWCAEPHGYMELIENNMLSKIEVDYPDLPRFENIDNPYMAIARLIKVSIAVNTNIYNDENCPESFEELQNCIDLALADPYSSGSSLYTVSELASLYGWEYFKKLKENGTKIVNGSSATVFQVMEGNAGVTIAPDYIVTSAVSRGGQMKIIKPEDGVIMIPSPIAVVNGTKNMEDALTFINYILSDDGQRMLYSVDITPSRGEYSENTTSIFSLPSQSEVLMKFDEIFLN